MFLFLFLKKGLDVKKNNSIINDQLTKYFFLLILGSIIILSLKKNSINTNLSPDQQVESKSIMTIKNEENEENEARTTKTSPENVATLRVKSLSAGEETSYLVRMKYNDTIQKLKEHIKSLRCFYFEYFKRYS